MLQNRHAEVLCWDRQSYASLKKTPSRSAGIDAFSDDRPGCATAPPRLPADANGSEATVSHHVRPHGGPSPPDHGQKA